MNTFEANLGGIELSCAAGIVVTDYDLRGDVEWRDGKLVLLSFWRKYPSGGGVSLDFVPEDALAHAIAAALREWAATDEGQKNLRWQWERELEARAA